MSAEPSRRSPADVRNLFAVWWTGGPTYAQRMEYFHNRSLLPMIRLVVSTCAALLGLTSFLLITVVEPGSTVTITRQVVAGVVAMIWAVRWQVGAVPSLRVAIVFFTTSILAIFAAVTTLTDPMAGALGLASIAMIMVLAALVLSAVSFVAIAALVLGVIAVTIPPMAADGGWLVALVCAGVLAGTTVGVPSVMQFGVTFSWTDTAEAGIDQLTGAYNRRGLTTIWATWAVRRARTAGRAGVLVLDLDGFKAINDTHGHAAGDQVLVQLSRIIRSTCADVDAIVARFGGDEFAILVLGHDDAVYLDLAERLRHAISEIPPVGSIAVTASVGVIGVDTAAAEVSLLERLLVTADSAMYQAKRTGNAVVLHPDSTAS